MNSLQTLLEFLTGLERRKISYRLEHNRADSLMVLLAVPGERWEVEFFPDGNIELEVFGTSSGVRSVEVQDLLHTLDKHAA